MQSNDAFEIKHYLKFSQKKLYEIIPNSPKYRVLNTYANINSRAKEDN